jgi:hypothetical protein
MSDVQNQRWRVAAPKSITVSDFRSLIEELGEFLPGLKTIRRSIKAQSISPEGITNLEGNDSWKVYQPYAYDKLEHLQFELTLVKTESTSCELHVEFRKNHIYLSVADIGTGWGNAVFDETERRLKKVGLFKGDWISKITSTVIRLQNVFMVLGASLLLLTHLDNSFNFKYFSLSLLATGIIPTIGDIFRLYFPTKPIFILKEKATIGIWSIEKFAMWLGIASGLVALTKELCLLFGTGV